MPCRRRCQNEPLEHIPFQNQCSRHHKARLCFAARASVFKRELPASLSYHQLTVNGTVRNMAVINSDNLNLKTLCTMPGEDLPHGGLVEWMGNHWLITEKDANNELYTKGTMKQCNYLLRWIAEDDTVVERWCVIGGWHEISDR